MSARRYLSLAVTLLAVSACGSKEEDSGSTPAQTTTAAAVPTTTTTTAPLALTVEGPQPKAGIDLRVKAEVDGRSDGITGTALPAGRASLQTPTGWTTTKGDVTVVASADKKAQIAAAAFGTEGAEGKLAAVATAMGLTACEWNPGDRLTIGKTALAGTGADGKCMKGAAAVKTAYVAPTAEGMIVVGAWEADGDSANVFGAMRSIAKAAGGAGAGGLGPCCAALRQNANSAPPDQKAGLIQAAAICDGLRNNPQTSVAIAAIRGALRGANMPSSCK
jgi:hypothetical protein